MRFTMPILMRLKGNRFCPTVVCDVCGQAIEDAKDGNAQWVMDEEEYGAGAALSFTHKECCHAFDTGPFQESLVGAEELAHFLVFLANNLCLDWEEAKKSAAVIASLE
jgi:hypothetical protein